MGLCLPHVSKRNGPKYIVVVFSKTVSSLFPDLLRDRPRLLPAVGLYGSRLAVLLHLLMQSAEVLSLFNQPMSSCLLHGLANE